MDRRLYLHPHEDTRFPRHLDSAFVHGAASGKVVLVGKPRPRADLLLALPLAPKFLSPRLRSIRRAQEEGKTWMGPSASVCRCASATAPSRSHSFRPESGDSMKCPTCDGSGVCQSCKGKNQKCICGVWDAIAGVLRGSMAGKCGVCRGKKTV